jgi:uncharacterized OB-fold protein
MTALVPPGWDRRQLLIQRCASCGHHQYYPRPICLACQATDLALVEASGRGRLYSFTVVHRSVNPRFQAPYTVALVDLEEGPRLLTHLIDSRPDETRCDAPVRLAWLEGGAEMPLPAFTPLREGSEP